ncbi:alternative oxidase [Legionella sp. km535]|uniref:alternative oxidase n=1 Tax=Legionella sp. km535 TaxID=2498107 RepID=UPI001F3ACCE6|nr:alternative oxidase [Legionella sp. km535]
MHLITFMYIAKAYWGLASDARLREVLLAVRIDEEEHRDVNHQLADKLVSERTLLTKLESELTDNKSRN